MHLYQFFIDNDNDRYIPTAVKKALTPGNKN